MSSLRDRVFRMLPCLAFAVFAAVFPAFGGEGEDGDWNSRSALEARRTATLSCGYGSEVVKIHREMGERFQKGDVLVELDDTLPKAGLGSAEAVRDAAKAALSAVGSMYEKRSASQVELAEAKRDRAEAELRIRQARHDLGACRITAPFAGRVVEALVNEHELLEKGTPVIVLMDDSSLIAKFLFPEERFARVNVGDSLEIRIPVAGVSRNARVSHISPGIDPASRTFDVWAVVENGDGMLRAGMTAVLAGEPGITD